MAHDCLQEQVLAMPDVFLEWELGCVCPELAIMSGMS